MPLSHLPAFLTSAFADLAHWLDRRSAARLPLLLLGILFATRPPHRHLLVPRRRHHRRLPPRLRHRLRRRPRAPTTWPSPPCCAVTPLLGRRPPAAGHRRHPHAALRARRSRAPASTTTPRPGPAGEKYVYGHVWVTLAALADHPDCGTIALPLQAQLYVRAGRPAPSCPRTARAPSAPSWSWPPSSCAG